MSHDLETLWPEDTHWPENGMMDAILYDGKDPLGSWRSHMREVTMARQAAERRLSLRTSSQVQDRPARLVAAQERAEEFRIEMGRINDDHRRWRQAHGELTLELPDRGRQRATELDPISEALESEIALAP